MKNVEEKPLWDILVRVFHWSLVAFVAGAFITSEDGSGLHFLVGYVIIALIILRIIWGFVGTKHARFSDFVKGPNEVIAYIKGLIKGRPPFYFGHNPAGGLMIVAILITLLCVAYTGIKTKDSGGAEYASFNQGFSIVSVAYADDGYEGDDNQHYASGRGGAIQAAHEKWEEVHELFAGLLIFLISIHIAAVLLTWFVMGENLIKSMITGKKTINKEYIKA